MIKKYEITFLRYNIYFQIDKIFCLNGRKFKVADGTNPVTAANIGKLTGKTVFVTSLRDALGQKIEPINGACCRFV